MNEKLLEVIPVGRFNAIHLKDGALKMGVTEGGFKNLVRKARKDGAFILSDTCGYWQSDDRAEVQAFLDSMDKQAKSRFSSTKSMRNYISEVEGQLSIEDIENTEDVN